MFYLISSVKPSSTATGGEIILHRHFVERADLEFKIVDIPLKKPALLRRLERTRFAPYIKSFLPWYESYEISVLKNFIKPAFILTVAHERACFAAAKAAAYWKIPLVTIFHDWYPASSGVHPKWQRYLDNEFRKLYRSSALAFCVSKQMKQALGDTHTGAFVLPPIPSIKKATEAAQRQNRLLPQLLYSGFCGGAYAGMLQNFINASGKRPYRLAVSGSYSDNLIAYTDNIKIYGFLDNNTYASIFDDTDILLVFLNFEQSSKQHFETHFPSKIIEYAGKGKLIAIWGPAYSTAIQWAKEHKAAFYYDKDDVNGFISGVLNTYANDGLCKQLIANSLKVYEREFAPDVVDSFLKEKLKQLVCKN